MSQPNDICIEGGRGYRDCRFCAGRGCLACAQESERDRDYAFDHPIFSGDLNKPEDMKRLRSILRRLGVGPADRNEDL